MIQYETGLGNIKMSNEYFAKLVGRAATSCFGVAGMVPQGLQKIKRFFKKNKLDTGVVVTGDINSVSIDLHIIVCYGMNITAIAQSIIHKVKYTVEEATGIKVDKVTIRVDGVKD